jgi:N-acetyl-gamma-glutamyl-phosphate reductase
MGVSVAVVGASGYAGGELLRLLALHPTFELGAAAAGRWHGREIVEALPQLAGLISGTFVSAEEALGAGVDVCFCCLPSGSGDAAEAAAGIVVDLSDTHRGDPGWVYGLAEFDRESIETATRIANPGCYPTAVQLALVPFVRAGVVDGGAIVDAISGVSGAGRKDEDRLLFANLDGDIGAYGTVEHRHVPEMEAGLQRAGGREVQVSFTPHLAPLSRGLVATCRMRTATDIDDDGALAILQDAYADQPFVTPVDGWVSPKPLAGTNRATVSAHVDARTGWLIASAALDNLGKGAAGQAIQNANLAMGLPETAGLEAIGVWP